MKSVVSICCRHCRKTISKPAPIADLVAFHAFWDAALADGWVLDKRGFFRCSSCAGLPDERAI